MNCGGEANCARGLFCPSIRTISPAADHYNVKRKASYEALNGMSIQPLPRPDDCDPSHVFALSQVEKHTTARVAVYQRNGVSYITCRAFRAERKKDAVAWLRAEKLRLGHDFVAVASENVASVIASLMGGVDALVPVACGHSRRPDCFSFSIANAAAALLGAYFRPIFATRFMRGSSHPRENALLPPLTFTSAPDFASCAVVDDVATSGFHIHEAVTALRARGVRAVGVVWIGGKIACEREPHPVARNVIKRPW